jgi:hypothetical protein
LDDLCLTDADSGLMIFQTSEFPLSTRQIASLLQASEAALLISHSFRPEKNLFPRLP